MIVTNKNIASLDRKSTIFHNPPSLAHKMILF